ncbi:MAG: hypothetical protein AAF658_14775 [Myxococcota bacterium]
MTNQNLLFFALLAFVMSFTAAYFAAGWVAQAVTDHAAEQVITSEPAAVVVIEC